MKNKWASMGVLCAGVVLAVLLGATGCDSNGGSSDGAQAADSANGNGGSPDATASADTSSDASKTAKRKPRESTTSVRVSNALLGDLVVPVVAEGTIRARHSAELKTEIAGRITRVLAQEGQVVRRGALIAKLDDREYAVSAEEARAKYFEALSLLAIEDEDVSIPERPVELQEQVDDLRRLESRGVISRQERLVRETELDLKALKDGYYRIDVVASRSGITAARAALERAKLYMERTEIRAPFAGIVTGLALSAGEQVTLGQTICQLVNNTDIEAAVGVLESDLGKLQVGRPALLAVPALADTFRVTVDVISPQFDRDSRTCQVLLRLENSEGRVRPGMFTRAIIAGETLPNRLLVPREAILTRDGRPLLFKVEGGRAKWLYLKIGRQNDVLVEIERVLQGGTLAPDDPVIVTDHLTLAHDAKVKVKKVIPIQDPWGPQK